MPSSERWSVLRRHPRLLAAAAALVAALALVSVLGGFAASEPDGVRRVEPGEEVDVAPLRIRLDAAEAVREAALLPRTPGVVYLLVSGELSVPGDEPVLSGVVDQALAAEIAGGLDAFGEPTDEVRPTVTVAGDGSTLVGMGPGVDYDIRLVYRVVADRVPAELALTLRAHVRRPSSLDGQPGWHDPFPAAEVVLPVEPLPERDAGAAG